jgi:lysophospholipase L1-like esterase
MQSSAPLNPRSSLHARLRQSWRLKLGLGVALALIMLLGLELAAQGLVAITGKAKRQGEPLWFETSPTLGWVRRANFTGIAFGTQRQFDANGLHPTESATLAQNLHPRIAVIGDSTSFGYGVDQLETYAAQLARRHPQWCVLNLATSGHSSFQGLGLLRTRVLALHPDIVIAAFNFNDRRSVFDDETDNPAHFAIVDRSARRRALLQRLALVRIFERLIGQGQSLNDVRDQGPTFMVDRTLDLRTAKVRVSPADYTHNLEQMAAACAQAGSRLVLLMLGDNPKDLAPMLAAQRQARAGQPAAAVATLMPVIQDETLMFNSLARVEVSRIVTSNHLATPSAEIAVTTRSLYTLSGGMPLFYASDYQQCMRVVAQKLQLPLVEAAPVLDAQPVYLDFCHFNARGHQLVADLLDPVLSGLAASPSPTTAVTMR